MDERGNNRTQELVARVIAAKVEDLQRRGMKPDQIAAELRKVSEDAGVTINCEVREFAGLRMLDVRIGQAPPGAPRHPFDVKTGPDVKAPASKCPGPHYAAPCCGAEICFHDAKRLGKSMNDAEETACCIDEEITVTILGINGRQVQIGVNAPKTIPVHRQEIHDRIKQEAAAAAGGSHVPG